MIKTLKKKYKNEVFSKPFDSAEKKERVVYFNGTS